MGAGASSEWRGCKPFTGSALFDLADRDGTHVLFAQYQDASAVKGPVLSSSVVLDRSVPTGGALLLNGGAAFTRNAQSLTLTLDASDAAAASADTSSGLAAVRISATSTVNSAGELAAVRQVYQRNLSFTRPTRATAPRPSTPSSWTTPATSARW